MKSIFFALATIVACVSHMPTMVNADLSNSTLVPAPKGTIGHTAILANNTVFIQGGSSSPNQPSGASYAILLNPDGSMRQGQTDAVWVDTTELSNLDPRDFSVSAAVNDKIVNCGTQNGARGNAMTCNLLDTMWYNNTQMDVSTEILNRGGMAYTLPDSKGNIYMIGGSTDPNDVTTTSASVSVLNLNTPQKWSAITNMPTRLRYHTATWVGGPVNGIVVLGGRNEGDFPMTTTVASVYSKGNWTTRGIGGANPGIRYGHTVTYDGKGTLYLYGGISTTNGPPLSDFYYLNVTANDWAWTPIPVNPEPRAFHAATLLKDNTILFTFGQTGADASTATNMYSLYDMNTGKWIAAKVPNAILRVSHSPNYTPPPPPVSPSKNSSPLPSNNPNNPNNADNGSSGSGSGSTGLNVPMIAGICAGLVILIFLVILAIILVRRRNRRRPVRNYPPGPKKDMAIMYDKDDEDEKSKQAKAFMIRRPPSVYVVNEQDAEGEVPHPHYKSRYYGEDGGNSGRNSPSIAEYELREAGGRNTLSTVSSVAERRRYVEEQQRQFMDDYENTYNHPPPFEPNSKEEHDQDDDDETLGLPSNRRANQAHSRGAGPRYPQNQRGREPSNYDIDDYLH
ncbi:Serine/threonine-protein phosphatase bsl1 [Mortierella sp. AM989]|nr:Serine/threonine-protein phosphatase bsl1 [Mortierella sp. AM989]